MKVYRAFPPDSGECGFRSAVTLGTYDGVHRGHQRILEQVISRSHLDGIESVVVTFDRRPSAVLNNDNAGGLLTTLEEKLDLFREYGFDRVYVLPFTRETAGISADTFIRYSLCGCLGMQYFAVGYDHGFGRNREVSTEKLADYARELSFELEVVSPVMHGDVVVKSSTIRAMIREGDVRSAAMLLGRIYSLGGTVVHGAGIGARIGIPTANLKLHQPEKILPGQGVYAGWGEFGNTRHLGVISVGPRPTFDLVEETLEIHLPDYAGDLYGMDLRIGFSARLRDIVRYDSRDALVERIRQDIEESRQFTVS